MGIDLNHAIGSEAKHVILVGASVGHAWNIAELPKRIGVTGYTFEFIGEYEFDKSEAVGQIVKRTSDKPFAVFLKECAAYFPGDFEKQKRLMQGWIEELSKNNIVPIPTTVVPVTSPDFLSIPYFKDVLKKVLPLGKVDLEKRLRFIVEYNDWIKKYSKEKGLSLLDLEAALRRSDSDRRLRADLTNGDGLHLNPKAYALLDPIVVPVLSGAK